MRHSNLAAAVIVGIGMFTGQAGAQQAQLQAQTEAQLLAQSHADAAMRETLARRVRAVLEAAIKAKTAGGRDIRFQFNGDVDHLRSPTDCGMPVIKGDPAIDPQFSKQPDAQQPPGSTVRHTMKVIPVQPCLR